MTCEELRSHFEENRESDIETDRAATEHFSVCADCSRFAEERRVLARNLTSVRQSVGQVPESLDAAVIARYRHFVAEREQMLPSSRVRFRLSGRAWAWGAAVAAVLAVTAFWVFSAKHTDTTAKTPTSTVMVPVAQVVTPNPVVHSPGRDVASNVSTKRAVKHHAVTATKTAQSRSADHPTSEPVRVARSLPEGFRSLMYCDELSCPEAMDIIRVQLPASAMPRQLPGLVRTGGSVTADVLVGSDGIARGIRFEEIEF